MPRDAGSLLKLEKARNRLSSRAPRRVVSLTLDFRPVRLHNFKIINVYCVKPLILWRFITIAIGNTP